MGCGVYPFQCGAEVECDEDLVVVIQVTQVRYAKALKNLWMEHD